MTKLLRVITLAFIISISCKTQHIKQTNLVKLSKSSYPVIVDDRDNKSYEVVKVYNQIWFKENLNFETPDSKCYQNKKENCDKNGRLYGITELENICPEGWRVPDLNDWIILKESFGPDSIFALLDTISWDLNSKHTDESGLSLKGVGYQFDKREFIGNRVATSIWLNQINRFDEYYHTHIYGGEGTHFEKSDYRTNEVLHAHPIENLAYRRFSIRCICENPIGLHQNLK